LKIRGKIAPTFRDTGLVAGAFRTDGRFPDWEDATLEIIRSDSTDVKKVYQWRYRNEEVSRHWKIARSLLTESEAAYYYVDCEYQKHSGPFEVPE
jgi:hypothetical protein